MSNNHDDNEFLKAKKGKEYLERATQLISNTQAKTLITDEVKAEIERIKREEEERIRKQKQEKAELMRKQKDRNC